MKILKAIIVLFITALPILIVKSQDCPCVNTKEINPVCGNDNITYINPGQLNCLNQCEKKSLEIVANNPCPCLCPNTRERYLVCADDDNTYVNPGAVKCHNQCNYNQIKIVNYKPCHEGDKELPY